MASILELPSIRHHAAPLSVEEYHRFGERDGSERRTELLRGFIIEKMVPSPRHTFLVTRLSQLTEAAAGPGLLVRKEDPLTLADSEPQPDVALVTGTLADYAQAHPATALLVIEVALNTEERDREKAALYAEAGVEEYWLVLPERGLIEVHTAPRDGLYTRRQLYGRGETLISIVLPALHVEIVDLFRV